jgi:hypothetical protein
MTGHTENNGTRPTNSNRLLSRRQTDIEILRLCESIQAGNLADRASLDEFQGLDRELLMGINSMLDAMVDRARAELK